MVFLMVSWFSHFPRRQNDRTDRHGAVGARPADPHEARDPCDRLDGGRLRRWKLQQLVSEKKMDWKWRNSVSTMVRICKICKRYLMNTGSFATHRSPPVSLVFKPASSGSVNLSGVNYRVSTGDGSNIKNPWPTNSVMAQWLLNFIVLVKILELSPCLMDFHGSFPPRIYRWWVMLPFGQFMMMWRGFRNHQQSLHHLVAQKGRQTHGHKKWNL